MDPKFLAEVLEHMTSAAMNGTGDAQEYADELTATLDGNPSGERSVVSFHEGGFLTDDAGFVVRIGSEEFQVTVVKTR